ncbi:hypothetical protein H6P81_010658 [Aristolochia fimbriata]|uniref:Uncharacterized protein n=1 Tax=Aristolochia fimbriata TaxID=158543 RepID=A0AAV7ETU0_ARIFI|nr:hypothetical protein H6P81_010658 [Aristolochia fimbriata]
MRNTLSSAGGRNSGSSSAPTAEAGNVSKTSTASCSKVGLKRGPWTPEEDELLSKYINREGEGRWRTLPRRAGLLRCGKSCRLRWMNYLRPSVKRGHISPDEEDLILRLHRLLGNRWSLIAGRIPGRTDNEIKNYWNTHLSKKLVSQGIDPRTHKPLNDEDPVVGTPKLDLISSDTHVAGRCTDQNITGTTDHDMGAREDGPDCVMVNAVSQDQSSLGNSLDEDGILMDYCCDDVFSSFFNSLMNEDALMLPQQQQQQQQQQQTSDIWEAAGSSGANGGEEQLTDQMDKSL